ncbi:MAG: right-handed parallel beta-helix repeat-containing protein, partial [Desulfocurvibacter africanus]
MPRCFMSILLFALLLRPCPGLAAAITITNPDEGSLRAAIADSWDVINLTSPSGPITLTLTSELLINKNLTIIGPGADVLTVSGSGVRCFNITAGSVTLSGLTIADGNAGTGHGGCILIGSLASLTLVDCSVVNGRAQKGACIYSAGSLTMSRSTVHSGIAVAYGGGIASNGTLVLENCTLNDCSAGINGGGFWLPAGNASLTRCSIVHCVAAGDGGGIGCESATVQMRDCLIRECRADYGGGYFCDVPGGIATLVNCTLANNTANHSGGGVYIYGTMQASFCTITPNGAASAGSFYFWLWNPGSSLKNSILAGNTVGSYTDLGG